jgi:hypothetical protein
VFVRDKKSHEKREWTAGCDDVFVADEEALLRVGVHVKRKKWVPDVFGSDSGSRREGYFVCKRQPNTSLVPSFSLHIFRVYIGQIVSVGRRNVGAARFVAYEVEIRGKRQCEASAGYGSHG